MSIISQPALPVALSSRAETVSVSVIIVNYNGLSYLDGLLSSLAATLPPHSEIILVDNQSRDGSADYVAAHFPRVTLIRSLHNLGFGRGNNLGAALARGEYLVFINPDTTVAEGWLPPLIDALRDPSVGMATSRILMMNAPETVNACGNALHYTGVTLCLGMGQPSAAWEQAGVVGAVSGAAFAMRRDDFMRLGGFDEMYFLYMEDTDLSLRVRLAGLEIRYVPESLVYHDYRLKLNERKVYYQELHRYFLLLKHLRWQTLFLMLPALLMTEITTWAFVLLREPRRYTNKLNAYRAVLVNRARILAHRRHVQAFRLVPDRAVLAGFTAALDFGQVGVKTDTRLAALALNPLYTLYYHFLRAVIVW